MSSKDFDFKAFSSDPLDLLKQMLTIRALEQRALDLSRTTPPTIAGSIHLCAGQEAVPVGTMAALNPDDQVVATYRGHGWALACGLSVLEVLGEICHRTVGLNGGRGGSAYMMAPERGFIGENSIVGGGLPIACGVALANVSARNNRVVVVSLGDGAFNQGAVHEGLAFAAARQLPLIVICENNGWSEMTPTALTFKVDRIAQRANGYGMPGVTIDGIDPREVMSTVRHVAERVRQGRGPVLVECRVPRLWGHYNRDIEHYRSRQDKADAQARDPVEHWGRSLISEGLLTACGFEDLKAAANADLDRIAEQVLQAPEPDPAGARRHVWVETKVTIGTASADSQFPVEAKEMTYIQAVNEALRRELESRPHMLVYGEDVGQAGGIFGAARNLQKTFGAERVFDTPISESAILGSAVGAALMGMKPVVEIMWADFMLVALDQLINQAANVRYLTQGRCGAPLVVRTQQGVTPGSCAQHSQSLEALLAHIPGLRIAIPATPQDAYDLLRSAIAAEDPCIVIESRSLYQTAGTVRLSNDTEPMGKARLHRSGTDAVVVVWGTQVPAALAAADALKQENFDVGVLDLRWVSPLDEEALVAAVRNAAGRVIVAHEANRTGGFGAEVVTRLHELLGSKIKIEARRVAMPDVRVPAAPSLQRGIVPQVEWIIEALHQVLPAGKASRR